MTEEKKAPSDGVAALRPVRQAALDTAQRVLQKIQSTPHMKAVKVEK